MTTDIERLAKRLYYGDAQDEGSFERDPRGAEMSVKMVRAILTELREPTQGMWDAGYEELNRVIWEDARLMKADGSRQELGPHFSRMVFRAMIDHILGEK